MADPVQLLRTYYQKGLPVEINNNFIIFGNEYSAEKNALSNYRKAVGGYYTLETLYFLLKNSHLPHSKYIVQAKNAGIPPVTLVDRKELLSFLHSEKDTAKQLDDSQFVAPALKLDSLKHALEPTGEESHKRLKESSDISSETTKPSFTEHKSDSAVEKEPATQPSATSLHTSQPIGDLNSLIEPILKRERLLRDRNSILRMKPNPALDPHELKDTKTRGFSQNLAAKDSKNFSNILSILNSIRSKDDFVKVESAPPAVNLKEKNQLYDRYQVQEKDFWQERFGKADVDDFQIDTLGSNISNRTLKSSKQLGDPQISINSQTTSADPQQRNPIIIVPAAANSLITLYNVNDFLENGNYIPSAQKKAQFPTKPKFVTISRKKTSFDKGKHQNFDVFETTTKFTADDWRRVVAVFAQGPAWQFKDWPWKSPVDIFVAVKGFHVNFDDMACDSNIKTWDVTLLTLNKNRRHLDSTASLMFWKTLDKFMIQKQK